MAGSKPLTLSTILRERADVAVVGRPENGFGESAEHGGILIFETSARRPWAEAKERLEANAGRRPASGRHSISRSVAGAACAGRAKRGKASGSAAAGSGGEGGRLAPLRRLLGDRQGDLRRRRGFGSMDLRLGAARAGKGAGDGAQHGGEDEEKLHRASDIVAPGANVHGGTRVTATLFARGAGAPEEIQAGNSVAVTSCPRCGPSAASILRSGM